MAGRFQHIKDKKILIYGTGKIAERLLLEMLPGFQVIGVVDRTKFCGEKCGFPILMWDDIQPGTADVVIIAARQRFYQEIYRRIIEKCISQDIQIYGANGQNLLKYFGVGMNPYQDFKYYEKNAKELKEILAGYDVISFDIFDTLIMRKTLEPADVFDMVEARLESIGIVLKGFKAIRRQAELSSKGQNIYVIYDILQEMTGVSDEWKTRILEEELKCEKEVIVRREAIVDIYNAMVKAGKRVYLVSDMYLTSELMESILHGLGIQGYVKLYVSCEHGVGKGNGLFLKVREEIGDGRYIHVGDNEEADIKSAIRYGLDSYRIYSAYDMLRNSNLHYVLGFTNSVNDKNLIGLIISGLFNDPFSLYHTSGVLRISSLGQVGIVMLAPLAVGYISLLMDKIKRINYEGILFTARDEYFFKKLYDRLYEKGIVHTSAYYIYSSRKLSIRSGMDTRGDIETALRQVPGKRDEDLMQKLFGVKCFKPDGEKICGDEVCIDDFQKEIIGHSLRTRKNYIDYLITQGIDFKKRYLLCEMDGKGTSHYYLNRFFECGLDTLYVTRHHFMDDIYRLESEAMYDFWPETEECSSINSNIAFVESIFSAPHPSVEDMDAGGQPVFAGEARSPEQIEMMRKIQSTIADFCVEYLSTMFISSKSMNRELPVHFLELFPYIVYEGECEALYQGKLYDEMGDVYLDMIPGKG